MPSFRDDHIIVIQTGSLYHRATFGLAESLEPPTIRVRTRVGKNDNGEYVFTNKEDINMEDPNVKTDETKVETSESTSEQPSNSNVTEEKNMGSSFHSECKVDDFTPLPNEIQPIQRGRVVDWEALKAFWKHLYSLLLKDPNDTTFRYPVCLVIPTYWSLYDRELATQFFFEECQVPGFTIAYEPLMGLYAIGILHGLVIDIGYEKTDITPILDGQIIFTATQQLPLGGRYMTQHLQNLLRESLPTLKSSGQYVSKEDITELFAEQVKCSEIAQVVRDEQDTAKDPVKALTSTNNVEEEDPAEDIGKIIASGQTRAYLAQKEREKNGESEKDEKPDNTDVEFQTIAIEPLGDCIVGRERFKICEPIFHRPSNETVSLPEAIYITIKNYAANYKRRNDLWENIIVLGCGSRIRGFRECLIQQLQFKYQLSGSLEPYYAAQGTDSILGMTTMPPTPYPALINPCKILPDYFPSWKPDAGTNAMFEELAFLGGSIVAKTSFNESVSSHYVTLEEYAQHGPTAIHTKQ
ncbi:SWI/SNF and RSC complexes subunit arp9 [Schizosaccharomyces pombe]|uniref:SWI/SNF and RSC complexes subunit arp9 n=1 Tax=Schizosaccharomyces pombe (strain 972 / ATCC 24843) TaxID=284812 RepID=ARP9_SCHPO|nr:SWI/SNF and RSC complex subunit Arp9 [Schizosaccharomyces pombe]Q9UTQ7.1 RecName: Full=SWI/SNF and RSC complexes subunit arp9; AltName: Full=Actin-like protein arp9; AltName: Full=Actin-related protein 9; AltName: Full=Chromatin structure-remodeling complex subunit arp9 [Schizosaccharomyces pombe 972h-]CAB59882.1 SWI/SNF and RSC complex subunit Arp9 [Schizosaccharomyces pombe]|eukprot:NP_594356.1 SWI/SNF and RSC complex subunit Arp9 [Schizosaccharomyces pombe]